jgi:hypothetical protein
MGITLFPVDAVDTNGDGIADTPTYTGRMLREALSVLGTMGSATRPLGGLSGVRPGTPTSTVTVTSTQWTVAPHAGLIDAEAAAEAGPYLYAINAALTGAMVPADASNPRIDTISIQVSDPAESDGSTMPGALPVYTQGDAAASPVAKATPARSLLLATINVPKAGAGSPSVTWRAPWLAAAGGKPAFQTLADLQAWTPADSAQEARVLADPVATNNGGYVWSGSAWLFRGDTGWMTVALASGITTLSGASAAAARLKSGLFMLRGAFVKSGGYVSGDVLGTVPSGARPSTTIQVSLVGSNGAMARTAVTTDGAITIAGTPVQTIGAGMAIPAGAPAD